MQKVIGLDIGSYSIKAIEIVNTFKSYEITNFYETVIPHSEGASLDTVIPDCMEKIFAENKLVADRIVTAMPGQFISSRVLTFNFSDPRKIDASILGELEDRVPFNLSDMVVDHQILGSTGKKTHVLVVMTRKAFLKNFLDLLGRVKIEPKVVDIDSLAFYKLVSYMGADAALPQCYALIDIGHEKTSVCIVEAGLLRMFRSINLGGRYVTDFLTKDLEIGFEEAQVIKHRVSAVRPLAKKDDFFEDADTVDRITLACNAIIKELGRTFYSSKSWDQVPIQKIFVSGGTSSLKYFPELLAEQLEVPVERLSFEQAGLKISPAVAAQMAIVPQSLAIGFRAVSTIKKHSQINLRKGDFAFIQNYEALLRGAALSLKIVAVAVAMLVISYVFKFYFYKNEIDKLQEQYVKEYQSSSIENKKKLKGTKLAFAKMRKDAESSLKQALEGKRQAVKEYTALSGSSDALRALEDVSEAVPKEVTIDVTMFDYRATQGNDGKLSLRAETDNFASQASIVESLKKIGEFKKVDEKTSGAKPGSDGKKIEFTLEVDYSAQEVK